MKFEDLPEYIQKHASRMVRGYRIEFPNFMATDKDRKIEIPNAEKWLKQHNVEYNSQGYWFISFEEERKEFIEYRDLPKVFIGETELNVRDFNIGKLKNPKRVTKFARKR